MPPTRIDVNNAGLDYASADLCGFGVGGGANDGSVLILFRVKGIPIPAGVMLGSREEVDAAIEAMQEARVEAFGK